MLVHDWTIRLAYQVAPDEAPMAAAVVDEFLAGGQRQKDLLPSSTSMPGAFGPGELFSTLPSLLFALAGVGTPLLAMLTELSNASKFLDVVKTTLAIVELKLRKDALAKNTPAPVPTIPQNPEYVPLSKVIQGLTAGLQSSGLPAERCDVICYRVLLTLLEDPKQGAQYVKELSNVTSK